MLAAAGRPQIYSSLSRAGMRPCTAIATAIEVILTIGWTYAVSMDEAFDIAALRHFRDAVLLDENHRISNADQLFGFAAECAIKFALLTLPGCRNGKALAEKFREHIDLLWDRAALQGLHRAFPNLLGVLRSLQQPYSHWSTGHRYAKDESVSRAELERSRQAAKRLLASVGLNGTRGAS